MIEMSRSADLSAVDVSALTPLERLKNILGGSAGNFVEWFDWWAYLSFAIYFSATMFPDDDQTTQLLKSYVPFAAGSLARPVGAYLFGVYADRSGRKAALSLSALLMCIGSLLIALIPTNTSMPLLAPALLSAARIFQGLSLGGEYGASATYISEMASRKNRGFWSGFLYVTMGTGQLAAVLLLVALQHALTETELEAWGWRVPFAVGALLAITVFWLRLRLLETPSFTATKGTHDRGKTMLLFTKYPKESLLIVALTGAGSSGFYFFSSYMKDFLVNSAAGPAGMGFSRDDASLVITGVLMCFLLFQLLLGALSDRIGRRLVLMGGFGLSMIAAYPVGTAIMAATNAIEAFLLLLLPIFAISAYTSLSAVVKAELFPAHIRALGVAVPYAIAQALFSGNIGAIALALKKAGNESLIFIILTGLFAAGFVTAFLLRDTRKHSLILED